MGGYGGGWPRPQQGGLYGGSGGGGGTKGQEEGWHGGGRALEEGGLRVPVDVSVLGFDDIYAAAFHNPALTTIRQPLFEMGSLAAVTLLDKLESGNEEKSSQTLHVEPTRIVRESKARVLKN